MEHINENGGMASFQGRDNARGLPFYGQKGDFNFVSGRSRFTPGISIKLLPLSDMSRNSDIGISEFDSNVNKVRHFFKPGDRVRGILVNSQLDTENGKTVIGKLDKVDVNRRDHTIKIFIKDPKTLESKEIYVDTVERIFESASLALTFSQFINS